MTQADLFADTAALRRDLGIARVRAGAGDEWVERAANHLRSYAWSIAVGQPFLVEDAAAVYTDPPRNGKAWGPAVKVAAARGWLIRAGYAPARSSNLSPKCTWRAP